LGDTKELSVKAEAVESRFSSEDDIPKGWKSNNLFMIYMNNLVSF
jgi:hypothetical protein